MNQKLTCSIYPKNVAKITMLFAVTFVIYGFILNATTSQSIGIENYKIIKNYIIVKNV